MEGRFWVQQQFDDTIVLTPRSAATPLTTASVPTLWLQYSYVPTPRRPPRNPSHRLPHRYEIPPRMRSQRARINSTSYALTGAAVTFQDNAIALDHQNSQTLRGRNGSGLSEKCIYDFLLSKLSRLTTSDENKICTICQDQIHAGKDRTILLSCSHMYHAGCIKKWLRVKNQCANCRAPAIYDDNISVDN